MIATGLLRYVQSVTTRNERAGIDDHWHKRVKDADGAMRTLRSAVYGKVSRWRVRWVDATGAERIKNLQRKADAQAYLNGLAADVQRGEYVDPSGVRKRSGRSPSSGSPPSSAASQELLQATARCSTP